MEILIRNSADLCGSIDAVKIPYFEILREPPKIPEGQITVGFHVIQNAIKLDTGLAHILYQIQHVTSDLHLFHLHKSKIHPLSLREDITYLQYALLSSKFKQNNTRENLIHEVLRLGLIMYLVTLLNETPPGMSVCDTLGARLNFLLADNLGNSSLNLELYLWLMFIAASVVGNPVTKRHFIASATETVEELGISGWEDAKVIFECFFWVEKIHEGSFRLIWDALEL